MCRVFENRSEYKWRRPALVKYVEALYARIVREMLKMFGWRGRRATTSGLRRPPKPGGST